MAKNRNYNNSVSSQQDAIRKAKGNPNKNVHRKKNNSNYGGGDYLAQKIAQKNSERERVKLPTWMKVMLGVLLAVLIVTLILRLTVFKESAVMTSLSSLMLGITCGALFYIRRFKHTKKEGSTYKVITVMLAIMCVLYGGLGLIGLVNLL